MHSPTGYFANFVSENWAPERKGLLGRYIDTLPVVCFEQGEAMVSNDQGELVKAKDALAEIQKDHEQSGPDEDDGSTWKAHLEVSPYARDEE